MDETRRDDRTREIEGGMEVRRESGVFIKQTRRKVRKLRAEEEKRKEKGRTPGACPYGGFSNLCCDMYVE